MNIDFSRFDGLDPLRDNDLQMYGDGLGALKITGRELMLLLDSPPSGSVGRDAVLLLSHTRLLAHRRTKILAELEDAKAKMLGIAAASTVASRTMIQQQRADLRAAMLSAGRAAASSSSASTSNLNTSRAMSPNGSRPPSGGAGRAQSPTTTSNNNHNTSMTNNMSMSTTATHRPTSAANAAISEQLATTATSFSKVSTADHQRLTEVLRRDMRDTVMQCQQLYDTFAAVDKELTETRQRLACLYDRHHIEAAARVEADDQAREAVEVAMMAAQMANGGVAAGGSGGGGPLVAFGGVDATTNAANGQNLLSDISAISVASHSGAVAVAVAGGNPALASNSSLNSLAAGGASGGGVQQKHRQVRNFCRSTRFLHWGAEEQRAVGVSADDDVAFLDNSDGDEDGGNVSPDNSRKKQQNRKRKEQQQQQQAPLTRMFPANMSAYHIAQMIIRNVLGARRTANEIEKLQNQQQALTLQLQQQKRDSETSLSDGGAPSTTMTRSATISSNSLEIVEAQLRGHKLEIQHQNQKLAQLFASPEAQRIIYLAILIQKNARKANAMRQLRALSTWRVHVDVHRKTTAFSFWRKRLGAERLRRRIALKMVWKVLMVNADAAHLRRQRFLQLGHSARGRATLRRTFLMWHRYSVYMNAPVDEYTHLRIIRKFDEDEDADEKNSQNSSAAANNNNNEQQLQFRHSSFAADSRRGSLVAGGVSTSLPPRKKSLIGSIQGAAAEDNDDLFPSAIGLRRQSGDGFDSFSAAGGIGGAAMTPSQRARMQRNESLRAQFGVKSAAMIRRMSSIATQNALAGAVAGLAGRGNSISNAAAAAGGGGGGDGPNTPRVAGASSSSTTHTPTLSANAGGAPTARGFNPNVIPPPSSSSAAASGVAGTPHRVGTVTMILDEASAAHATSTTNSPSRSAATAVSAATDGHHVLDVNLMGASAGALVALSSAFQQQQALSNDKHRHERIHRQYNIPSVEEIYARRFRLHAWDRFLADDVRRVKLMRSGVLCGTDPLLNQAYYLNRWRKYIDYRRQKKRKMAMANRHYQLGVMGSHFFAWLNLKSFGAQTRATGRAMKSKAFTVWKRYVFRERRDHERTQAIKGMRALKLLQLWRYRTIHYRRHLAAANLVLVLNRPKLLFPMLCMLTAGDPIYELQGLRGPSVHTVTVVNHQHDNAANTPFLHTGASAKSSNSNSAEAAVVEASKAAGMAAPQLLGAISAQVAQLYGNGGRFAANADLLLLSGVEEGAGVDAAAVDDALVKAALDGRKAQKSAGGSGGLLLRPAKDILSTGANANELSMLQQLNGGGSAADGDGSSTGAALSIPTPASSVRYQSLLTERVFVSCWNEWKHFANRRAIYKTFIAARWTRRVRRLKAGTMAAWRYFTLISRLERKGRRAMDAIPTASDNKKMIAFFAPEAPGQLLQELALIESKRKRALLVRKFVMIKKQEEGLGSQFLMSEEELAAATGVDLNPSPNNTNAAQTRRIGGVNATTAGPAQTAAAAASGLTQSRLLGFNPLQIYNEIVGPVNSTLATDYIFDAADAKATFRHWIRTMERCGIPTGEEGVGVAAMTTSRRKKNAVDNNADEAAPPQFLITSDHGMMKGFLQMLVLHVRRENHRRKDADALWASHAAAAAAAAAASNYGGGGSTQYYGSIGGASALLPPTSHYHNQVGGGFNGSISAVAAAGPASRTSTSSGGLDSRRISGQSMSQFNNRRMSAQSSGTVFGVGGGGGGNPMDADDVTSVRTTTPAPGLGGLVSSTPSENGAAAAAYQQQLLLQQQQALREQALDNKIRQNMLFVMCVGYPLYKPLANEVTIGKIENFSSETTRSFIVRDCKRHRRDNKILRKFLTRLHAHKFANASAFFTAVPLTQHSIGFSPFQMLIDKYNGLMAQKIGAKKKGDVASNKKKPPLGSGSSFASNRSIGSNTSAAVPLITYTNASLGLTKKGFTKYTVPLPPVPRKRQLPFLLRMYLHDGLVAGHRHQQNMHNRKFLNIKGQLAVTWMALVATTLQQASAKNMPTGGVDGGWLFHQVNTAARSTAQQHMNSNTQQQMNNQQQMASVSGAPSAVMLADGTPNFNSTTSPSGSIMFRPSVGLGVGSVMSFGVSFDATTSYGGNHPSLGAGGGGGRSRMGTGFGSISPAFGAAGSVSPPPNLSIAGSAALSHQQHAHAHHSNNGPAHMGGGMGGMLTAQQKELLDGAEAHRSKLLKLLRASEDMAVNDLTLQRKVRGVGMSIVQRIWDLHGGVGRAPANYTFDAQYAAANGLPHHQHNNQRRLSLQQQQFGGGGYLIGGGGDSDDGTRSRSNSRGVGGGRRQSLAAAKYTQLLNNDNQQEMQQQQQPRQWTTVYVNYRDAIAGAPIPYTQGGGGGGASSVAASTEILYPINGTAESPVIPQLAAIQAANTNANGRRASVALLVPSNADAPTPLQRPLLDDAAAAMGGGLSTATAPPVSATPANAALLASVSSVSGAAGGLRRGANGQLITHCNAFYGAYPEDNYDVLDYVGFNPYYLRRGVATAKSRQMSKSRETHKLQRMLAIVLQLDKYHEVEPYVVVLEYPHAIKGSSFNLYKHQREQQRQSEQQNRRQQSGRRANANNNGGSSRQNLKSNTASAASKQQHNNNTSDGTSVDANAMSARSLEFVQSVVNSDVDDDSDDSDDDRPIVHEVQMKWGGIVKGAWAGKTVYEMSAEGRHQSKQKAAGAVNNSNKDSNITSPLPSPTRSAAGGGGNDSEAYDSGNPHSDDDTVTGSFRKNNNTKNNRSQAKLNRVASSMFTTAADITRANVSQALPMKLASIMAAHPSRFEVEVRHRRRRWSAHTVSEMIARHERISRRSGGISQDAAQAATAAQLVAAGLERNNARQLWNTELDRPLRKMIGTDIAPLRPLDGSDSPHNGGGGNNNISNGTTPTTAALLNTSDVDGGRRVSSASASHQQQPCELMDADTDLFGHPQMRVAHRLRRIAFASNISNAMSIQLNIMVRDTQTALHKAHEEAQGLTPSAKFGARYQQRNSVRRSHSAGVGGGNASTTNVPPTSSSSTTAARSKSLFDFDDDVEAARRRREEEEEAIRQSQDPVERRRIQAEIMFQIQGQQRVQRAMRKNPQISGSATTSSSGNAAADGNSSTPTKGSAAKNSSGNRAPIPVPNTIRQAVEIATSIANNTAAAQLAAARKTQLQNESNASKSHIHGTVHGASTGRNAPPAFVKRAGSAGNSRPSSSSGIGSSSSGPRGARLSSRVSSAGGGSAAVLLAGIDSSYDADGNRVIRVKRDSVSGGGEATATLDPVTGVFVGDAFALTQILKNRLAAYKRRCPRSARSRSCPALFFRPAVDDEHFEFDLGSFGLRSDNRRGHLHNKKRYPYGSDGALNSAEAHRQKLLSEMLGNNSSNAAANKFLLDGDDDGSAAARRGRRNPNGLDLDDAARAFQMNEFQFGDDLVDTPRGGSDDRSDSPHGSRRGGGGGIDSNESSSIHSTKLSEKAERMRRMFGGGSGDLTAEEQIESERQRKKKEGEEEEANRLLEQKALTERLVDEAGNTIKSQLDMEKELEPERFAEYLKEKARREAAEADAAAALKKKKANDDEEEEEEQGLRGDGDGGVSAKTAAAITRPPTANTGGAGGNLVSNDSFSGKNRQSSLLLTLPTAGNGSLSKRPSMKELREAMLSSALDSSRRHSARDDPSRKTSIIPPSHNAADDPLMLTSMESSLAAGGVTARGEGGAADDPTVEPHAALHGSPTIIPSDEDIGDDEEDEDGEIGEGSLRVSKTLLQKELDMMIVREETKRSRNAADDDQGEDIAEDEREAMRLRKIAEEKAAAALARRTKSGGGSRPVSRTTSATVKANASYLRTTSSASAQRKNLVGSASGLRRTKADSERASTAASSRRPSDITVGFVTRTQSEQSATAAGRVFGEEVRVVVFPPHLAGMTPSSSALPPRHPTSRKNDTPLFAGEVRTQDPLALQTETFDGSAMVPYPSLSRQSAVGVPDRLWADLDEGKLTARATERLLEITTRRGASLDATNKLELGTLKAQLEELVATMRDIEAMHGNDASINEEGDDDATGQQEDISLNTVDVSMLSSALDTSSGGNTNTNNNNSRSGSPASASKQPKRGSSKPIIADPLHMSQHEELLSRQRHPQRTLHSGSPPRVASPSNHQKLIREGTVLVEGMAHPMYFTEEELIRSKRAEDAEMRSAAKLPISRMGTSGNAIVNNQARVVSPFAVTPSPELAAATAKRRKKWADAMATISATTRPPVSNGEEIGVNYHRRQSRAAHVTNKTLLGGSDRQLTPRTNGVLASRRGPLLGGSGAGTHYAKNLLTDHELRQKCESAQAILDLLPDYLKTELAQMAVDEQEQRRMIKLSAGVGAECLIPPTSKRFTNNKKSNNHQQSTSSCGGGGLQNASMARSDNHTLAFLEGPTDVVIANVERSYASEMAKQHEAQLEAMEDSEWAARNQQNTTNNSPPRRAGGGGGRTEGGLGPDGYSLRVTSPSRAQMVSAMGSRSQKEADLKVRSELNSTSADGGVRRGSAVSITVGSDFIVNPEAGKGLESKEKHLIHLRRQLGADNVLDDYDDDDDDLDEHLSGSVSSLDGSASSSSHPSASNVVSDGDDDAAARRAAKKQKKAAAATASAKKKKKKKLNFATTLTDFRSASDLEKASQIQQLMRETAAVMTATANNGGSVRRSLSSASGGGGAVGDRNNNRRRSKPNSQMQRPPTPMGASGLGALLPTAMTTMLRQQEEETIMASTLRAGGNGGGGGGAASALSQSMSAMHANALGMEDYRAQAAMEMDEVDHEGGGGGGEGLLLPQLVGAGAHTMDLPDMLRLAEHHGVQYPSKTATATSAAAASTTTSKPLGVVDMTSHLYSTGNNPLRPSTSASASSGARLTKQPMKGGDRDVPSGFFAAAPSSAAAAMNQQQRSSTPSSLPPASPTRTGNRAASALGGGGPNMNGAAKPLLLPPRAASAQGNSSNHSSGAFRRPKPALPSSVISLSSSSITIGMPSLSSSAVAAGGGGAGDSRPSTAIGGGGSSSLLLADRPASSASATAAAAGGGVGGGGRLGSKLRQHQEHATAASLVSASFKANPSYLAELSDGEMGALVEAEADFQSWRAPVERKIRTKALHEEGMEEAQTQLEALRRRRQMLNQHRDDKMACRMATVIGRQQDDVVAMLGIPCPAADELFTIHQKRLPPAAALSMKLPASAPPLHQQQQGHTPVIIGAKPLSATAASASVHASLHGPLFDHVSPTRPLTAPQTYQQPSGMMSNAPSSALLHQPSPPRYTSDGLLVGTNSNVLHRPGTTASATAHNTPVKRKM